jgi:predicted nucleic acid-binding protein
MADFVIDASAALSAFFKDERTEAALRVVERLSDAKAVAPAFFFFEFANGLAAGSRRGRLTAADSREAMRKIATFEIALIEIDTETIGGDVMPLAARHRLTVYDAAYLYLAMTLAIPIATHDGRLRTAAVAERLLLPP